MKTEDLGNSKILNLLFRPAGVLMGSKVRQWIFDPEIGDVRAERAKKFIFRTIT